MTGHMIWKGKQVKNTEFWKETSLKLTISRQRKKLVDNFKMSLWDTNYIGLAHDCVT